MNGATPSPPRPSGEAAPAPENSGRNLRSSVARARAAYRRAKVGSGRPEPAHRSVIKAARTAVAEPDVARARSAWIALIRLWLDDDDALLVGRPEHALWRLAVASGGPAFRAACVAVREDMPLVFPPGSEDPLDPRRIALRTRRARLDRLYGEALAADGLHDFAVEAGFERLRREAYPHDAVRALHRAGRVVEALAVAREALASPTTVGVEALRLLVDRLFPERGVRRRDVRATESEFLARPTREGFDAYVRSIPPNQRAAAASRVLTLLQRTQKEPSLVFALYLEQDRLLDADGMATTQAVAAEALAAGADRILPSHPAMAAGWLLVAAHRLADAAEPDRRAAAVVLLARVRDLSAETGRTEDFRRALGRLKSRHSDRPAFLKLLKRHGL